MLNRVDSEEFVSPAQVAEDVNTVHESLDRLKEWSLETIEWLASEHERLVEDGETEYATEIEDLMLYVQTVFLRLEYGDQAVRAEAEEKVEEAGETVEDVIDGGE